MRSATGININVLIEDVSITGCKIIAKQALDEKWVAITLRIRSADMNSYERQQDLQLRAKIVRDSKGPALHNNDRRYHYGLVSTNIDITQAK